MYPLSRACRSTSELVVTRERSCLFIEKSMLVECLALLLTEASGETSNITYLSHRISHIRQSETVIHMVTIPIVYLTSA